jgi:O-antigen/teichoic acid export membrane protein
MLAGSMESGSGNASPQSARRRATAWGIVFGYASLAVTITRNILLVPAYLHFMTLAEYGAWLATGATAVQWLISDFGLSGVLMQRSAALHGAGESSRLGTTISSGLLAGLALALTLSLAAMVAIPHVPEMGSLTVAQSREVTYCLYVAVFAGALGIIATISQGLLRSLQHAAAAGSITLAAELAGIATTLIGLVQGIGLVALAYGLLVRSAVAVTGQTVYLLTCTGVGLKRTQLPELPVIRELFSDGWISFISSLAMKTPTQANTLLIGYTLGPASAATYGLTVRAHEAALLFLGQMNGSIASSMAHLWGSGNIERFRVMVVRITLAGAMVSSVAMAVIIATNAGFVALWLHSRGFAGQSTSILMAVVIWVSIAGYAAYDSLYSMGRFRIVARTFICGAAVHLIALVSLLRFGVWVAPLSTLISTLVWGGIFWWHLWREIQLPIINLRLIRKSLEITGGCAAVVAILFLLLVRQPETWLGLAATAIGSAASAALLILLVSPRIRSIMQVEAVMTARALLARHHI